MTKAERTAAKAASPRKKMYTGVVESARRSLHTGWYIPLHGCHVCARHTLPSVHSIEGRSVEYGILSSSERQQKHDIGSFTQSRHEARWGNHCDLTPGCAQHSITGDSPSTRSSGMWSCQILLMVSLPSRRRYSTSDLATNRIEALSSSCYMSALRI